MSTSDNLPSQPVAADGFVSITSPKNGEVVTAYPVPVTGSVGANVFVTLGRVNADGSQTVLGVAHPSNPGGGPWLGLVRLQEGEQKIVALATDVQGNEHYSDPVTFRAAWAFNAPVISGPAADSVQSQTFVLTGTKGIKGATVLVFNSKTDAVLGTSEVLNGTDWQCLVSAPPGLLSLVVMQAVGLKVSPFSPARTFTIALAPVITAPAAHSKQPETFTLSGNMGVVGATVVVFRDLTDTEVGRSAVLTGANWSCPVKMPVGRGALVAHQVVNGQASGRSALRSFDITPPALADIQVIQPALNTVKFSGKGHTGATVEISVVSGPSVTSPPAVEVKNGVWDTTASNWPYGTYRLSAIQKVADGVGGWIASTPFTFSYTVALPGPTDVVATKDYTPTISGRGVAGALVVIFDPSGPPAAAGAPVLTTGVWSSRVYDVWGPTFERRLHLQQRLNGQSSPPGWLEIKVTIPPLAPVITTLVDNGLSPHISGTCWPGAVVNLVYSDSGTVHPLTGTNGSWTFRRDLPFAPGTTHTATVTQTAAQQTSPSTSRSFQVSQPMLTPQINHPTPDAEVGRVLTVRGDQGMAGASMQLRDAQFDRPLGPAVRLTSTGPWSIELGQNLEFRRYTLDAQQTLDAGVSERSEYRFFNVVLPPPLFTLPEAGKTLPRVGTISGEAIAGASIDVWEDGTDNYLIRNMTVFFDGRWQQQVTLPIGVTSLRARQTFIDEKGVTQISRDSPPLTFSVVPAAPLIESPVKDEHLGQSAVISGFGYPGDKVSLSLEPGGGTEPVTGTVEQDRTWSVVMQLDLAGGPYHVKAVSSNSSFVSAPTTQPVMLDTYTPTIDVPQAGSWVHNPVEFRGQGTRGVGRLVSWYDPEHLLAQDIAVTDQGWKGLSGRPLRTGGNWCRFKQTTENAGPAKASRWGESERFEVEGPSEN